jgi:hypothetical protein
MKDRMSAAEYLEIIGQKQNKYRNKKTVIDDIEFDSKKEADRYCQLKLMKRAGQIIDFELQPRFVLLPAFDKNGIHYRPIVYIADFKVIYLDGHIEIEDTKGIKTKEFILKQKLFENQYPDLSLKII